jgi:hypothetical protein
LPSEPTCFFFLSRASAKQTLLRYSENDRNHEEHVSTVKEWMADAATISNPSVAVICTLVLMNEGQYDVALRACHGGGTAELQSLKVQTLLRMNRPDLAWSELQQLQRMEVPPAVVARIILLSPTRQRRMTRA